MKKMFFLSLTLVVMAANLAKAAEWTTQLSKDKMTGKISAYAFSSYVKSTEPMKFPYQDIKANIAFGCDAKDEWAYIHFTKSPNLTGSDIRNGYSSHRIRIRWDDRTETIEVTQKWGEEFLHFGDYFSTIKGYMESTTLLIEMPWYGGDVYFEFGLVGASKAINKARVNCGKK